MRAALLPGPRLECCKVGSKVKRGAPSALFPGLPSGHVLEDLPGGKKGCFGPPSASATRSTFGGLQGLSRSD